MNKRKTIKYTNEQGLSLEFGDTAPMYLEKIDATSLSGVFSADTLARSAGQITTYKTFGARAVPCDFAVVINKENAYLLDEIIALFNPSVSGVLTITAGSGIYEIDCYPQSVPNIKMDSEVYHVYRFSIDFVCDYPHFRQKGIITRSLSLGENIVNIRSTVPTPVEIYIPNCEKGAVLSIPTATIKVLPCNYAVTVNTRLFTAVNSQGYEVNAIDVSSNIEEFRLNYGKNIVTLGGTDTAALRYYNLFLGVI